MSIVGESKKHMDGGGQGSLCIWFKMKSTECCGGEIGNVYGGSGRSNACDASL